MDKENAVKGYKVFNQYWTCIGKQYSCPGRFEEDVPLSICEKGMHFCKNAEDCFNYYEFDSNNHVAEVIAYGHVVEKGDKCCTDRLEIVRELSWHEVLDVVNIGKNCTGVGNAGNWNTGDRNTGDRNTGNRNTGDCNTGIGNAGNWNTGDCNTGVGNTGNYNTGDRNTGHRNTGHRNTGYWNTGDRNAGDRNAGDWNAGNWNTGDRNTGDRNTGNYNTGDRNTGNCNTGDRNTGNCNTGVGNTGDRNAGDRNTGNRNTGNRNTGNRNTGDWNTSSFNTGCFMTEEQKIYLFNRPSGLTYSEWEKSSARYILCGIPNDVVEWVFDKNMSDEEKSSHPEYKTTGGYLKVLDKGACAQMWWDGLPDEEREIVMGIPNFDRNIFKECTGIDVDIALNNK